MKPAVLPEGWIDVDNRLPENLSPVCGLVYWANNSYKRELVTYTPGWGWGYAGSDQRCRDVVAWAPLPPLPPRKPRT